MTVPMTAESLAVASPEQFRAGNLAREAPLLPGRSEEESSARIVRGHGGGKHARIASAPAARALSNRCIPAGVGTVRGHTVQPLRHGQERRLHRIDLRASPGGALTLRQGGDCWWKGVFLRTYPLSSARPLMSICGALAMYSRSTPRRRRGCLSMPIFFLAYLERID